MRITERYILSELLTLVIGGAASGKSVYAEEHALSRGKPLVYLATAQAFDDEMRAKIDTHIARRGPQWRTIESPLNAVHELGQLETAEVCLFDCATLWLSNQLLAQADLELEIPRLITALETCKAEVIIVSNEVGHGVVPDHALGRQFRDAQGRLNILLARISGTVVQVTVGIPRVLKGQQT